MSCDCGSGGCKKGKLPFSTILLILSGFVLLTFIISCKQKPDAKSFDHQALVSRSSLMIQAFYSDFSADADSLYSAVVVFNSGPDQQNLLELRQTFKRAYLHWQRCSFFEFGPADQNQLRVQINTFPTDTLKINSNIISGTANLGSANQFSAKGLPAIDFLLYGLDSNRVLSRFTTGADITLRKNYLLTVAGDIKNIANTVSDAWNSSGGNYAATYSSNTSLDAGSSISLLVNQFNFDLEWMKNGQVGIPLGKKTMGSPLPQKCEAYYSGYSLELIVEHLNGVGYIWWGFVLVSMSNGLNDAIAELDIVSNGKPLQDVIKQAIDTCYVPLHAIQGPLSVAVVNNPASVDAFYTQLLQLIILTKSDMASAMGILITYQDADGD